MDLPKGKDRGRAGTLLHRVYLLLSDHRDGRLSAAMVYAGWFMDAVVAVCVLVVKR
jgi:hypothetical protein